MRCMCMYGAGLGGVENERLPTITYRTVGEAARSVGT
jgi:hypothetical protein